MIIWVVEDVALDAQKAVDAIKQELRGEEFSIFVNRDINWPPNQTLPHLEPFPGKRAPHSPKHLPDIVALDLLRETEEQQPASDLCPGMLFYDRLREEERNSPKKQKSHVIIYSQFRGLRWTEQFVEDGKRKEPHHFIGLEMKAPALLASKVKGCWEKIQYGD